MLQNPPLTSLAAREETPLPAKKQYVNLVSEKVGQKIREIRKSRRLSIRALAELSGLSVNTLSLVENGRTSPSVNTLQQVAQSLNLPIVTFFESDKPKTQVVYQKAGERQQIVFPQGQMARLNTGISLTGYEPFVTRLEVGANSGEIPVTYPRREFIYCLEGHITYFIGNDVYPLAPGDSLFFDAHNPHIWRNTASVESRALLVICPEPALDNRFDHFQSP
jgi:transcriptional regulator with XRE-family HTH domain